MTYQDKISNIIVRLKKYRANHPEYTFQKISDHTGVSFTTVSRIFADGSEAVAFRFESINPIAQYLLGLGDLDEGNDDEQALKAILKFKDSVIEELEDEVRVMEKNYETKYKILEDKHSLDVEYYRKQIQIQNETITKLLNRIERQDDIYEYLNTQYLEALRNR